MCLKVSVYECVIVSVCMCECVCVNVSVYVWSVSVLGVPRTRRASFCKIIFSKDHPLSYCMS